jgi:hypothetical protein
MPYEGVSSPEQKMAAEISGANFSQLSGDEKGIPPASFSGRDPFLIRSGSA